MYSKIVIIEDNKELIEFLKTYLKDKGDYQVIGFEIGLSALKYLKESKPDLVIIDLMLEDLKGESICVELRDIYKELPIIILTANNTKESLINCLNSGADDYITKPFDADELLARIQVKLRNSNILDKRVLQVDDLQLDTETLEVKRGEKSIELTAKEFELLKYFLMNKSRILTRDKILNAVWGYDAILETRVVDVHVGKLRQKINHKGKKELIETYRGFGYKMED